MKFNILIDDPPEIAEVNGREYAIKTDFKKVLSYLQMLHEKAESDPDDTVFVLAMFFGKEIRKDDIQGLIDFLKWYINRGEEPKEEKKRKKEPLFDILIDSGRIYSAFFQVYHINLRKVQLHWWTFMELLEGLPKGTHLAEVIDIRGRKFEKYMKAAEKNELAELKKHYAIGEQKDTSMGLFESLKGITG